MAKSSGLRAGQILWHRLSDAVRFYDQEARQCKDPVTGAYLLYLHEKKRNQLIVFEKIAGSLTGPGGVPPGHANKRREFLAKYRKSVYMLRLVDIHDFAVKSAENDLDLFSTFLSLTDADPLRRLLWVLVELERDFLTEVRIGYLDFLSKEMALEPVDISPGFLHVSKDVIAA
ncbi:MAG: hypothetical protein GF418_17665 [Chitinivibrionales bacterium]|nr:hypothetical protein [Chitinivibrionales bacterium]MBD3397450.1 hypothetical protein [Chitinivibrionales bacterium]